MVRTQQETDHIRRTHMEATDYGEDCCRCPKCGTWIKALGLYRRLCILDNITAWLMMALIALAIVGGCWLTSQGCRLANDAFDQRVMKAVDKIENASTLR